MILNVLNKIYKNQSRSRGIKHFLYLTLRGFLVLKRLSRNNNESKSLFSHFMTSLLKLFISKIYENNYY